MCYFISLASSPISFPLVFPALEWSRRIVGGDCLMTFPFLAGTGPNFFNFGKVTRERERKKKEALILVIWNGRVGKTEVWGRLGFFLKEKTRVGKAKSLNTQVESMWQKWGRVHRGVRFWKRKQIKENISLEPRKREMRFFMKLLFPFPFFSVWATARALSGAQSHPFRKWAHVPC